jgi:hypothetical protein
LGCARRRPASIKASTAVLSLLTALAEDSNAQCTKNTAALGRIGVALRVPDVSDQGPNLLARELRRLGRGTRQSGHVMTRPA